MFNKVIHIFVILSVFALGGCAGVSSIPFMGPEPDSITQQEAELIYGRLIQLQESVRDVSEIIYAKMESFNHDEQTALQETAALLNVSIERAKLLALIHSEAPGGRDLSRDFQELQLLRRLIVKSYRNSRRVVSNHIDKFNPTQQMLLESFDSLMSRADRQLEDILGNQSYTNLNQGLDNLAEISKLVVKVLPLIAATL